jgi:HD-GYP domain-containing protein (c-di-GMP phosphodiesterase class II)
VRLVVLQHHERRDGSGYHFGLSGTPRGGDQQCLTHVADIAAAVVDVFTALIVDRPHRSVLSVMEVRRILTELASGTLHPEIVNEILSRWRPPTERGSSREDTNAA